MQLEKLYEIYLKSAGVNTDTRSIQPNELFFALKGGNFNGNKFAEQALEKGASYAIIDEAEYKKDERYILVDNVLDTLQNLAQHHRKEFKIPFIAITGSNGKTTTKELLFSVLNTTFKTIATKGNLNNHIGVPLTVLGIPSDTEMAIIEMGANHQNEINQLCRIALPNFGLITNIGRAHLEGFGGIEGVKKGKGELFEFLEAFGGRCFVNVNDERVADLAYFIQKASTYGGKFAHHHAEIVEVNPFLTVKWFPRKPYKESPKPDPILIKTQLVGAYNFDNVMAAIAVGARLKVAPQNIKSAIENYVPQNQRSEIVKLATNTIILDAYNANPTSMMAALENFKTMVASKKVVVLGEMLEMGEYETEEHQKIIDFLEKTPEMEVFLVGIAFKEVANTQKVFDNSTEVGLFIKEKNYENTHFLIKGSRGSRMEKVVGFLRE